MGKNTNRKNNYKKSTKKNNKQHVKQALDSVTINSDLDEEIIFNSDDSNENKETLQENISTISDEVHNDSKDDNIDNIDNNINNTVEEKKPAKKLESYTSRIKGKHNKINIKKKPELSDFMGNSKDIFSTNKQKYENTMSSAVILLVFGIIGLFIELLAIIDVIYLPILPFQYVLMFSVFTFFVVSGVLSYHKANSYKIGMNEEEQQRNNVDYFLNDLLTDQVLIELKSEELSEEENYILIINKLTDMILEKYPNYNKELLEYMIDDYLNAHF